MTNKCDACNGVQDVAEIRFGDGTSHRLCRSCVDQTLIRTKLLGRDPGFPATHTRNWSQGSNADSPREYDGAFGESWGVSVGRGKSFSETKSFGEAEDRRESWGDNQGESHSSSENDK